MARVLVKASKTRAVGMEKLPLRGVAEIAFLTSKLNESLEFYRMPGLDLPAKPERLNFANVGDQLFGFCDEGRGFIDGYGGLIKSPLHVAFEVPEEKLDDCVAFLNSKGVKTSPKNYAENWHGTRRSASIYFSDPAGNVIELWAPSTRRITRTPTRKSKDQEWARAISRQRLL